MSNNFLNTTFSKTLINVINYFRLEQVLMILLIFFGLNRPINAQILNIEKGRIDKDSSNYFAGNISMRGSIYNRSAAADNQVNFLGFNATLDLLYKSKKHAYIFITQIDYLKINENPFLNTGFSHLRAQFNRKDRVGLEVFSQYQYDNFRQLNPRILFGVAPRIKIIDREKTSLIASSGIMYESETWRHPFDETTVRIDLLKSTNYLLFRTELSDQFDLNIANYYQVGYDQNIRDFRHRVNFMINVLAKITQRLSFNFAFNIQYEDKPIVPITPVIYDIKNGITYQF